MSIINVIINVYTVYIVWNVIIELGANITSIKERKIYEN